MDDALPKKPYRILESELLNARIFNMEEQKKSQLSPAELADHDRSVHDYPWLDLEDDEYVVSDIVRTKIGRFFIWFCSIGLTVLFGVISYLLIYVESMVSGEILASICLFCAVISILIGIILNWIYGRNALIVTNQRVFGRVQSSLLSCRVQSLELEHAEDVSFDQSGLLPIMFNYGSIRMSTVGDEHTYKLTFADSPAEQVKAIKKVVHAVDEQEPTKYRK